jgi:hypothetical protein
MKGHGSKQRSSAKGPAASRNIQALLVSLCGVGPYLGHGPRSENLAVGDDRVHHTN